ncbi:hypothetical protein EV652_12533 [Kribbella steppae]|uniref:Uncharacterized protein n=2 Tax=Kribbella steppae TaxID=2512223 RepID=A0A4R2GTN0_9ACTN|nr:hypothetical protein EV652_12533 [Kribbella steppae]
MVTTVHRSGRVDAAMRTRSRSVLGLWVLMGADLAAVVWMYTFGSWLDHSSRLTATATLGGHHLVVLALAATGFALLATIALVSEGFTRWSPRLVLAKNAACVVSVMALAGLFAFILTALLSRVLFGRLRP